MFLLMINDLRISDISTWKYVDDTTGAKAVPCTHQSDVKCAVDKVVAWSRDNLLQLNAEKFKELKIDFKKTNLTQCVDSRKFVTHT